MKSNKKVLMIVLALVFLLALVIPTSVGAGTTMLRLDAPANFYLRPYSAEPYGMAYQGAQVVIGIANAKYQVTAVKLVAINLTVYIKTSELKYSKYPLE